MGAVESGAVQVGMPQIGAGQVGVPNVGVVQVYALQVGVGQPVFPDPGQDLPAIQAKLIRILLPGAQRTGPWGPGLTTAAPGATGCSHTGQSASPRVRRSVAARARRSASPWASSQLRTLPAESRTYHRPRFRCQATEKAPTR